VYLVQSILIIFKRFPYLFYLFEEMLCVVHLKRELNQEIIIKNLDIGSFI